MRGGAIVRLAGESDERSPSGDALEQPAEAHRDLELVGNGEHVLGLSPVFHPEQATGEETADEIPVGESFLAHEQAA